MVSIESARIGYPDHESLGTVVSIGLDTGIPAIDPYCARRQSHVILGTYPGMRELEEMLAPGLEVHLVDAKPLDHIRAYQAMPFAERGAFILLHDVGGLYGWLDRNTSQVCMELFSNHHLVAYYLDCGRDGALMYIYKSGRVLPAVETVYLREPETREPGLVSRIINKLCAMPL